MTDVNRFAFGQTLNMTNITFPASLVRLGANSFDSSAINYVIFEGNGPQYLYDFVFRMSALIEINFGKALKVININAFDRCPSLSVVTFHPDCPLSVIATGLFSQTNLTTITIPRNVEIIEENAFQSSRRLSSVIFLPDCKLASIGTKAFVDCPIQSIVLPKSVTNLSATIWTNNPYLTSLVFEEGSKIESFGTGDWSDCTGLVSVDIPSSITYFDPSAFSGCSSLIALNIDQNNEMYRSYNGVVYTKDGSTLICCPNGLESITVLNTVNKLAARSLYLCEKLSTIDFGNGNNLKVFEELTFYSCKSLRFISLPKSLTKIMQNAFLECSKLESIVFPDFSVCNLEGESIFENCISLRTVSFGKFAVLNSLGANTFKGCINLISINIPANCTTIFENCFENCVSLIEVDFERGSKLGSIGDNAFLGCNSLVTYHIPDSFSSVTMEIFGNAPNIKTIIFPSDKHFDSIKSDAFIGLPLENVTFEAGSTVDVINDGAFMGKKITAFKLNCQIILEKNSFKNCNHLKDLSIDGATHIGNYSFTNCVVLESVRLSNSCSIVGTNAFEGCTSLTNIIFVNPCKIINLMQSTFSSFSNLQTITIPKSILKISQNCFKNCIKLSEIVFESSSKLQTIEANVFSGCTLLSVFTIPDSFTTLSSSSFGNGPNIKIVKIPDNMEVNRIKSNSFANIPIETITLGVNSRITNIDNNAFMGSSIKSIVFNNFPNFGTNVFKDCISLTSLTLNNLNSKRIALSNDVYSIPEGLFDGCINLVHFEDQYEINKISDRAFRKCSSFDYQIPDTITWIGNNAFESCNLISRLPIKIEHIGNMSFYGTGMKTSIKLPSTVSYIGKNAFLTTKIRKVRYCGSNDLSMFDNAYNPCTSFYVTSSYPSFFICKNIVHKMTSCDEEIETQIQEIDILKSMLGPNFITFVCVMIIM